VEGVFPDLILDEFMTFGPSDIPPGFGARREIRLLVVDDQQEHFEHLLEAAGMYNSEYTVECRFVSEPQEALSTAVEWRPAVVLLDLHVVSSALDLLRQIAEIGPSVVATSATRLPDMAEKVSQCGGVGYLTKSDNPDDVESLLNYVAAVAAPTPTSH
jgi:CheY-like chemotaxis protein